MASTPDANPDSFPAGPSDSPEQVSPPADGGRESVEDVPAESGFFEPGLGGAGTDARGDDEAAYAGPDSISQGTDRPASDLDDPGSFGGTAGTGGENKVQDELSQ